MMRTLVVVLAIWLATPAVAEAHLVNTGLGSFFDGVVHFYISPEDLLPVIALALFAGLRGPQCGRVVLFVLPATWLVASFIGQQTGISEPPPAVMAMMTFALGTLAAADLKLPTWLVVACAVFLGLLHGGINGAELASHPPIGLHAIGIAISIFSLFSVIAGQAATIRNATARIAIRVAGSWIAAIGLLMLGWAMHA